MVNVRWLLRVVDVLVCGTLVAAAASCGGGGGGSPGTTVNEGAPTVPGARVIEVEASNFAYAPAAITVASGEQVTFRMTSTKDRHDLVIIDSQANKILRVSEGVTGEGGYTAPSEPGVYQFYCSEIGHSSEGMVGQLIVQ
jgi:plastocyanin